MAQQPQHKKLKLTPRDYLVIILIITTVVGAWFVVIALLMHLAMKGYAFYAWLLLLVITIAVLKRKRTN